MERFRMRVVMVLFVTGLFCMPSAFFSGVAGAAGPVRLELFDPTGNIEVARLYAGRLADLKGKTICEVSDRLWQADRMFELIEKLLKNQYPDARFIPYTEFPYGSVAMDNDKIGDLVKKKGCQAVIVGNAG